ncbi:hypothetical protein ACWGNA_20600 [Brucella cytisi]|uniref:Uncharacterized protein n=1 Tax=Brucella tritici TaxID=94626 RepID=A0A7X6FSG3_9HYPH|nr:MULTISPECIES: hypothetical protein [Brucella]NKC52082.1 hypothetical protein [Brucella cytisi]NKW11103.1 hypothetical protein [Brucella tritici]
MDKVDDSGGNVNELKNFWQEQKAFQLAMTKFNLQVETDKAQAQSRNRVADAVGQSGR